MNLFLKFLEKRKINRGFSEKLSLKKSCVCEWIKGGKMPHSIFYYVRFSCFVCKLHNFACYCKLCTFTWRWEFLMWQFTKIWLLLYNHLINNHLILGSLNHLIINSISWLISIMKLSRKSNEHFLWLNLWKFWNRIVLCSWTI